MIDFQDAIMDGPKLVKEFKIKKQKKKIVFIRIDESTLPKQVITIFFQNFFFNVIF